MKKAKIMLIASLLLVFVSMTLVGCGRGFSVSGSAPTLEQLQGRWDLVETMYREGNHTFTNRPGDTDWVFTGQYHITFTDNHFEEFNFWHWNTVHGTFVLDGSSLTLSPSVASPPIPMGGYAYINQRSLGLEGNILTMTYTRRANVLGRNVTWHYLHTFTKAA